MNLISELAPLRRGHLGTHHLRRGGARAALERSDLDARGAQAGVRGGTHRDLRALDGAAAGGGAVQVEHIRSTPR